MSRLFFCSLFALLALLCTWGCADKCEQAAAQHCAAKTDEELMYIYGTLDESRDRCVAEYVSEMCVSGRGSGK